MEDYKALYLSQHYHFPSLMQPQFIPIHDQEQNYYYALILIDYLSNPQQFTSTEIDDSYLKSIIQAIYYYKNDTHKFISKLSDIDSILLKQKNLEFVKALLSNKYIIEQDPDYILQIIKYSLSDQQVLTFIVMQIAQNQIKYSLKSLFNAIIKLQEVSSYIYQCFQYFYLNDQMFNLDLQSSGINLKLTINLIKRLLKWSNFSQQNILNEIDSYFQKNIGISEKQILIAYLLTANNSQLAIKRPLLLKIFIQAVPQNIFYFEKMLKYMRLHNHKDVDYAYRIGTLSLDEDQANLFRISLQFEQEIKKSLIETPNKGEILEILKQAFMREPYTFSLDFIVFLLKFDYQYESVQVIQYYWKLMKLINKFFFDSLYQQQIYNIFDYQGVFHDENGKSKLITKVGNMKKNAKVLIPYISQMILNSQLIIHLVSKYFIQMFVENNKIDYFYTNFIYEPYQSQDIQTINYQLSQKLFDIFPLILSKLRNGSQLCHKYLIRLKELLHFCAQNKSFHNLKKIEVLVLKLNSNTQETQIIQKIHEVIFEKVKKGVDQNQVDNILAIFDEKKSILFDFPEYKIFQNLLDIRIKIESYNILNPAHQYMFLSLINHLSDTFDKYLQQQFIKILIKKLPSFLDESGYLIQEIEQKQYQQEIQKIDQNGDIYYDIVDIYEENIRQYVKKRNQKQILILMQTIEQLIELNNINFEIEEFCVNLKQLLNQHLNLEDIFVLQYWNIAINILKKLDQFTSNKEMEIKILNSSQKLQQYEVVTKEAIQLMMVLDVDIKYSDIDLLIHCLDLINQLKNDQKHFMINLIFQKFQPKDKELFSQIYFERRIESEQIEITKYYLKQLILESAQLSYFIFTLRICCELTSKQIQEELVECISQNFSKLGIEYLAIIFIITYDRRSQVTQKAKCYLKTFQMLLQQLDNNVQDYCNLLNIMLFICQNETESEIIYTVFRKFFQLYIPTKKQIKCKNFMKKQLQILQQFSFFFNEIQHFQLKATLTFNPIKYFNFNTQKVPISVRETFSQIKYFEQMCQLSLFSFTETCKIQRKYIQDVLKQRTQEQQCIDSRIYEFQPKSKCIKQIRSNPFSASPVQFYSDNKGIEKIFKKY